MQPFLPGRCLFCPKSFQDFADSLAHMRKMHGFVVPEQDHLVFGLESVCEYAHLVICGYRECLECGTQRATVQGVQQHMTGKGHCRFDIADPESEFGVFYDYSYPDEDDQDAEDARSEGARKQPPRIGDDLIRLPSGRVIAKKTSTQEGLSLDQLRRRVHRAEEYTAEEQPEEQDGGEEAGAGARSTALTKRGKRAKAAAETQLARLRSGDRHSLIHLSAAEQRSVLATQFRAADRSQKQERRRQGKVDRKGNKNLYAYWHTETPVYQCG